ncbi:MAG TPA: hypothetical protein VFX97_16760 [Pyrinomonadaceae bacterium]|nr:hypothetical protein [Pyrinomonadaceae bacterium]
MKITRPSSFWRYLISISIVSLSLAAFFFALIVLAGVSTRQVAAWTFVAIWFVHLLVGAGAGYAAWRLWPNRENAFVKLTMVHLHAAIVDAIGGVVLIFLATNVRFTWKFSLGFFAFALARDIVRMPLILYIIRGPKHTPEDTADRSGEQHPDFWREEFRKAIRDTVKPDLLND